MRFKEILKKNKALMNLAQTYQKRFGITKYTEEMNEFCRLNRRIWENRYPKNTDDGIVLVRFSTDFPGSFWPAMKRAEALREKYGYKLCVILKGHFKNNNNIFKIIESFCVDEVIYEEEIKNQFKNDLKESVTQAHDELLSKTKNIDDFINWSPDDIRIGDLIYDSIVRGEDVVTLTDFSEVICKYEDYILKSLEWFFFYKKLFNIIPIRALIESENAYLSGISLRMAAKWKIKSVCINSRECVDYDDKNIFTQPFALSNKLTKQELLKRIACDEGFVQKCNVFYEERLQGKSEVYGADRAYMQKHNKSNSELIDLLGINKDFNTVLIASHCFSDCPHLNEQWIFRDYYDWLMFTLDVIRDVGEINVLYKPHPYSDAYGQTEIETVKKIVREYGFLKPIPDDLSTNSVLQVSDVVLTAGGTIGLEAACKGIESINVCNSYYNGFDVVRTIKDRNSYADYIRTLNKKREPIKDETILMAKAVLYSIMSDENRPIIDLMNLPIRPNDDLKESQRKQYEYLNKMIIASNNVIDQQYNNWLKV